MLRIAKYVLMATLVGAAIVVPFLLFGCDKGVVFVGGPDPGQPGTTVTGNGARLDFLATSATGDSLAFRLRWAKGARATGYLATVRATNGPWAGLPLNQAVADTNLGFIATNALYDTATFRAVVRSTNSAGTSLDSATVGWKVSRLPNAPPIVVVDSTVTVTPPPVMSLATNVLPILNRNCAGCHAGATATDGADYSTAAGIFAQVNRFARTRLTEHLIDPSFARQDSSYVICTMEAVCALRAVGIMPPAGALPQVTIDTIKAWINAGAPNN